MDGFLSEPPVKILFVKYFSTPWMTPFLSSLGDEKIAKLEGRGFALRSFKEVSFKTPCLMSFKSLLIHLFA